MKQKLKLFIASATVALMASTASASVLYGTVGQGGNSSQLYTVDTTTGTTSFIGDVGYNITGMDFHNGVLYGVTSQNDRSHHGLVSINTTTGAGSIIGSGWGATLMDRTIAGMAISASGTAYGWEESSLDDLREIDLATGLLTAAPGEAGLNTANLGLAFDLSGTLHLFNFEGGGVYSINTADGSSTTIIGSGNPNAHHGDVDPDTGLYWGLGETGSDPVSSLISYNFTTGVFSNTIATDVDLHTLAFAAVPVPAALPLLATALFGFGALRRRKKS